MSGNGMPEWIMLRVVEGTEPGAVADHVDGRLIDPEDCPRLLFDPDSGFVMDGWGLAERTERVAEIDGRPVRVWTVRPVN
jgi:hypothetical protein